MVVSMMTILLLVAGAGATDNALVQVEPASPVENMRGTANDTVRQDYAAGLAAGRLAATGKGNDAIGWTFAASLASGCCLGGLIPYPASAPIVGMSYPCIFGAAGGATTGLVVTNQGADVPPVLLAGMNDDYRLGFIEAYGQRVRELRSRKAWVGTALGTGLATIVGVIILVVAASKE
jgi:hypothetical protein